MKMHITSKRPGEHRHSPSFRKLANLAKGLRQRILEQGSKRATFCKKVPSFVPLTKVRLKHGYRSRMVNTIPRGQFVAHNEAGISPASRMAKTSPAGAAGQELPDDKATSHDM